MLCFVCSISPCSNMNKNVKNRGFIVHFHERRVELTQRSTHTQSQACSPHPVHKTQLNIHSIKSKLS